MTLSVYHSELAILFQDVEVTVSLHCLRKKPVLTSRSTAAGCSLGEHPGKAAGGNLPKATFTGVIETLESALREGFKKKSPSVVKIRLREDTNPTAVLEIALWLAKMAAGSWIKPD